MMMMMLMMMMVVMMMMMMMMLMMMLMVLMIMMMIMMMIMLMIMMMRTTATMMMMMIIIMTMIMIMMMIMMNFHRLATSFSHFLLQEQALSRNLISKEPFPLSNTTEDILPKIDLSQHLAREFYDSQNRTVSVFDDVVPKSVLFALRKYFFQYDSSYVYNVYDPAYTEDHDNVNWVAQVPVRDSPVYETPFLIAKTLRFTEVESQLTTCTSKIRTS